MDLRLSALSSRFSALYDLGNLGAVAIPSVLSKKRCESLLGEIMPLQEKFREAKRIMAKGKVIQEMKTLYFSSWPSAVGCRLDELPKNLLYLFKNYKEFYNEASKIYDFYPIDLNEVGIHCYQKGTMGITPHQDFKGDLNLIAVFILKGSNKFYVCSDREKSNAKFIASDPGSLILMRAARNKKEQKKRPFHFLEGPMVEDRYTVILRANSKQKSGGNVYE